ARPSAVAFLIPSPLESICMKAMQAEPKDRYSSARALADDIEHWLADEPIAAHAESQLHKLARWTRRHHGLTAAAAGGLLIGVMVTAICIVQQKGKTESEKQGGEAQKNYDEALGTLNDMFTELSEGEVANDPELQPLRTQFLKYYQLFVQ